MATTDPGRTLEELAYEQEELWEEGALGAEDEARVAALGAKVPADVGSLLDVGCGNGLFLRSLQAGGRRWTRLVGTDRSRAALKHVPVECVEASIDALPFGDGEFDLVSCFEVVEHLPLATYARGLSELGRVSAKYVLICVPFAEDLRRSLSTCPSCHTRFNVNYHLREYREDDMRSLPLPPAYKCAEVFRVGPTVQLAPPFARALATATQWLRAGAPLPSYAVCPMCGYQPPKAKRATPKIDDPTAGTSIKRRIMAFAPKTSTHRWIAALYEKRREDGRST